ncbi:rhomboid family intramembrane serine protease GlpG [Psychromonas sp. Urea-02u-13]|uniref:rhomboid family intramembrane serine protease GlpG n=1 Tax=Psychromonas sp. Urea-02u-13 TaxID=2058326 RepID=UPI000C31B940|nr:rhomboid family intramembrane serine protease GlpG [Psychromonas sp. Urea-02u-13]PKG37501.1 rhomboid family intramembrane serine protease GlpG [Psychromonas sp. Urea-02u-13]
MLLHQFQNLRLAQAFSDYLTLLNIANVIDHDNFSYQLTLNDSSQYEKAQAELALFLENPNQEKYLSASWDSGNTDTPRSELAYGNSNFMRNFVQHAGLLTHSVFAFCVLIFALTSLGLFQPMQSSLAFFTSQPFDFSQSWRFITPAFLHFSALHIVFNLLWWWQLAGIVEKQQGKQRLLILFLFTAVASNLAQYFLVSPYFGGLSGVVYGLVGYCWLFGVLNKGSKVYLANSYFGFLLFWLVLGFIDLLPVNVANYAHLVGLLAGLLLAFVTSKLKV